jgi:hypothetical protein
VGLKEAPKTTTLFPLLHHKPTGTQNNTVGAIVNPGPKNKQPRYVKILLRVASEPSPKLLMRIRRPY